MKFIAIAGVLAAAALFAAGPARAEMPVFAAECPQGNSIDADRTGTVRVNGSVASVQMFNENYYEAKAGSVTYTISHDADGSNLLVGYNPPGSAGGYCTILSAAAAPPVNSGTAGGDVFQVTGVPANDVLNVRDGPGTGNRIVGALGNGDTVRNLGCERHGNSDWCQIEMMTDMRERGWVNARYLTGGVASQLPSSPPQQPAASGPTSAGEYTVRFPAGSTNTTVTGRLGSEEAARYALGARDGQFLTVSLRPDNRFTYMIIYVPGGDILYESSQAGNEYSGQLYRTGDHVVEVFYKGEPGTLGNYDVYFEIR